MIFILLYWIYISALFFTIGHITQRVLNFIFNTTFSELQFAGKIVTGIGALMIILSIVHFLAPINGYIHLAIVLLLIIEIGINRQDYKRIIRDIFFELKTTSLGIQIPSILLTLYISYIATDLPLYNLDEGRYHFQALLWSKEYKIIPGLANLHARLGSNSSWYLLNAFFDTGFFNKKVFHIINPLMLLFILLYCIHRINNLFDGFNLHSLTAFFTLLYITYNFVFFRYWYVNGITPDMGIQFFIIVLTLYVTYLLSGDPCKEKLLLHHTVVLIMCGCALLSRISGIMSFILYLSIVPIVLNEKKMLKKIITSTLFILSVFFFILFTRNIVLSGYMIFPFKYCDYFPVDWKFPVDCLQQVEDSFSNHQLHAFMKNTFQYTSTFSYQRLHDLCKMLYDKDFLNFGQFTINLLCLPVIFINFFLNQKRLALNIISCFLFLMLYISSGGVYRFGSGYFCAAAIIPVSIFFENMLKHISLKETKLNLLKNSILLFTCLFLLNFIIIPSSPVSLKENKLSYPLALCKEISNNFISLHAVPSSPFQQYTHNNLTVNIPLYRIYDQARLGTWFSNRADSCRSLDPVSLQCKGSDNCEYRNAFESKMNWMNPLPSVGAVYKGIRLRGDGFENGFCLSNQ